MLTATNLHKSYRRHKNVVPVLRGLDLDVHAGEFLSVIGASGSGKSTLLHLLGTLDRPDDGEIRLDGKRIDDLPGGDRDALRNRTFGLVFQFYHLLPELTAFENVLVPAMIDHSVLSWFRRRRALRKQAAAILERVGLSHRVAHKPRELSGGEMQRAAIARALIGRPRVLLADEPTGNLDEETGAEIIKLLRSLNRDEGLTIVMVTHNLDLVAATDRVVRIAAGRIDAPPPTPAMSLFSEAC
ncbi:MAG TPA: ABC transporter ATP-binding protein [Gemmataceae bacterium]|jgi:lipoprotein-releasing system ATP-binding protein|nr:ABC transporter ATP-binding protein [Gemmataceae bacterium]